MTLAQKISELKDLVSSGLNNKGDLARLEAKINSLEVQREPAAALSDFLKTDKSLTALMGGKAMDATVIFEGKDAAMLRKSIITTAAVGSTTSGVLQIDRMPGVAAEPRQPLLVEALLSSAPTTAQLVDFIKVTSATVPASPQAESTLKPEAAVNFQSASERVRTFSTTIPASRQVLEDMTELQNFLSSTLLYYVDQSVERQILIGSGSAEDLNGLVTQATLFDHTLLPASANQPDFLAAAAAQLARAREVPPTFAVVNSLDFWAWSLQKTTTGAFAFDFYDDGTPTPRAFGLDLIPTTSISQGSFLVGSGSPSVAQVRNRESFVFQIAREHADFFVTDGVMTRGERRCCLVVKRPGSFVTGNFSSSPA